MISGGNLPAFTLHTFLNWGYNYVIPHSVFYVDAGNTSSGANALAANPLPLSHLQPLNFILLQKGFVALVTSIECFWASSVFSASNSFSPSSFSATGLARDVLIHL